MNKMQLIAEIISKANFCNNVSNLLDYRRECVNALSLIQCHFFLCSYEEEQLAIAQLTAEICACDEKLNELSKDALHEEVISHITKSIQR